MSAPAEPGASDGTTAQALVGEELWAHGDNVAEYANRELRPVEVLLLVRYRDVLSGRVLELGCGGGRLTGYLAEIGTVEAIDVSPAMVEYTNRRYPRTRCRQGDMRDLSAWESGSLDAIVAGANVLDVLDHAGRHAVLDELRRLLAPDGLLIFSAHNAGSKDSIPSPFGVVKSRNPARMARNVVLLPRRVGNRRRLRRFEQVEGDHAILNDEAHDFSILHYYIERDAQAAQLAEHGLKLVECLDLDGAVVAPGEHAPHTHELHYVARHGP
ncbi:MAG: class I SAM-dependent methyltransferase [Actinobacteria bacterium]|nr:class I SAM-dependent methyltransferase [Actinomycetota bacterium]